MLGIQTMSMKFSKRDGNLLTSIERLLLSNCKNRHRANIIRTYLFPQSSAFTASIICIRTFEFYTTWNTESLFGEREIISLRENCPFPQFDRISRRNKETPNHLRNHVRKTITNTTGTHLRINTNLFAEVIRKMS